jgi:uncharacterized protein
MHKILVAVSLIAVLAIGALISPFVALNPARASAVTVPATGPGQAGSEGGGSLRTTGSAVIRVQPDRASIRFGVQTFAETPRAAQSANETIVKRVLQAVRDQGIESRDIATDYFSVRPEYDYPMRGSRSLVGYWSENGLEVTLRDVSQLSAVLVAALDAGATSVDNLTFTTTRLRELRDEARSLAVKAALEKADALGTAAGIATGPVSDIQESSSNYYSGYWNRGGQWVSQVQNVIQEAPASSVAAELEDGEFSLGQIVVQAQVNLTVRVQ